LITPVRVLKVSWSHPSERCTEGCECGVEDCDVVVAGINKNI
jgi:hypothetical protein